MTVEIDRNVPFDSIASWAATEDMELDEALDCGVSQHEDGTILIPHDFEWGYMEHPYVMLQGDHDDR